MATTTQKVTMEATNLRNEAMDMVACVEVDNQKNINTSTSCLAPVIDAMKKIAIYG